jgi:uncharacterized membrane protein
MSLALWTVQGLLAVAFLAAGGMKLLKPREALIPKTPYAEDFSQGQLRLLGVAELLGAVGLILPTALGIVPVLTPVAALCLLVLMVGAVRTHLRRKEPVIPAAPFALLLVVVATGRLVG